MDIPKFDGTQSQSPKEDMSEFDKLLDSTGIDVNEIVSDGKTKEISTHFGSSLKGKARMW